MIRLTFFISFIIFFSACCSLKYNRLDSNGDRNGNWILTTGNDSLDFKIVRYSKNKINGNSVEYYENGSISKGKYQDDRKVGQWTLYGKDKKTIIKKLYYTEGFLSRIEIIEDGKVVKQAITDPPF